MGLLLLSVVSSSEGCWVLPQSNSRRCCHGLRRERLPQGVSEILPCPEKGQVCAWQELALLPLLSPAHCQEAVSSAG